ncbi:MAG: hypothetical protein CVT94_05715 [Bacteroidetes bacterium HGW-Bacteroidetes-11]|jgi:hypothetical protein|nr:MAG: hypothetical protein CVT94_05715 [Bacteroidetes bacterium HGW-Bacteroidetes-11]
MKNLLTLFFCIISFAAFSQSFIKSYSFFGNAEAARVDFEETGYRMIGSGRDIDGDFVFVLHLDFFGDTIKTRKMYFDFQFFHGLYPCLEITDHVGNHYIVISRSSDSALIVKYSPEWQELRRKSIPTFDTYQTYAITHTADNHLVLVCGNDLLKLDTDFNIIWHKQYGGETNGTESKSKPYSILEAESGDLFVYSLDYLLVAHFEYPPHFPYLHIFSTDGILRDSIMTEQRYECLPYEDRFICVGSYLNFSPVPVTGNYLMHHDLYGAQVLVKNLAYVDSNYYVHRPVINHESNLIFLGTGYADSYKSIYMHAASIAGDSLWSRQFSFSDFFRSWVTDIKVAPDGGYLFSTYHEANDNQVFPGLIKTDAMGNISAVGFEESEINQKVRVYPNPAAEYVVFELEKPIQNASITLTDIAGRQLKTIALTGEKTVWETSGVPSGVYLYRIEGAYAVASGKLVILK